MRFVARLHQSNSACISLIAGIIILTGSLHGCGGESKSTVKPSVPSGRDAEAILDSKAAEVATKRDAAVGTTRIASAKKHPAAPLEISVADIADKPVSGMVNKVLFAADRVIYKAQPIDNAKNEDLKFIRRLTLIARDEPSEWLELTWLTADDSSLGGQTLEFRRGGGHPANSQWIKWCARKGASVLKEEGIAGDYVVKLAFDEARDDALPGRIYLCFADPERGYLEGRFLAEVTREGGYTLSGKIQSPTGVRLPVRIGYFLTQRRTGPQVFGQLSSFIGAPGPNTPQQEKYVWRATDPKGEFTALIYNKAEGWSYRHPRLVRETYLVFVQSDEHYVDWKVIHIDPAAGLTLDFTLNYEEAGNLDVKLPEGLSSADVALSPDDIDWERFPNAQQSFLKLCDLIVPAQNGKAEIKGLRPTRYRVSVGGQTREVDIRAASRTVVEF